MVLEHLEILPKIVWAEISETQRSFEIDHTISQNPNPYCIYARL